MKLQHVRMRIHLLRVRSSGLLRTLVLSAGFAVGALTMAVVAIQPQIASAHACYPPNDHWAYYNPDHKAYWDRLSVTCRTVGYYADGDSLVRCTAEYWVRHYGFNEYTRQWYWAYSEIRYSSCSVRVENSSGSW